jgi:hypothetical protein
MLSNEPGRGDENIIAIGEALTEMVPVGAEQDFVGDMG